MARPSSPSRARAALFDADGDGDADLTERCGVLAGSFGGRRRDFGVSQLLLDAGYDVDGKLDFAITTYVLPVADVWFNSSHLQVGNVIGPGELAGSGLHLQNGEPWDVYMVFPYSSGTVEVIDTRPSKGADKVVLEGSDPEDWLFRWDLTFGDGAQHWVGEDWVQLTNTAEIGDPTLPPDWVAP